MKRLIVFIFLVMLFCLLGFEFTKNLSISDIFPSCLAEVYIDDCINASCGFESIVNGSGSIIFCKTEDIKYINQMYNVIGFTFFLEDSVESSLIKLNVRGSFVFGGYIYGICPYFGECILVGGNHVNFQCAVVEDRVVIGFPLLLGSY